MRITRTTLFSAIALLAAAPLAAQSTSGVYRKSSSDSDKVNAFWSNDLAKNVIGRYATELGSRRQPRIGVTVDLRALDTDKYGALITTVMTGSPAERAGLKPGDLVSRLAGKSLTERTSDEREGTTPGIRLTVIAAALQPGRPVDLDYRRGVAGKTLTVKVTPVEDEFPSSVLALTDMPQALKQLQDNSGHMMAITPRVATGSMADFNGNGLFSIAPSGGYSYSFSNNSVFGAFEMAPMNEKLGAYFGTTEGVLVVNNVPDRASVVAIRRDGGTMGGGVIGGGAGGFGGASGDVSLRVDTIARGGRVEAAPKYLDGVPVAGTIKQRPTIPLEPGDVIVSVDGRKVTTPSQLMRIVGSYDHGDDIKLQIMRQKHAETISIKMP